MNQSELRVQEIHQLRGSNYHLILGPDDDYENVQPGQFMMIRPNSSDLLLGRPLSIGGIDRGGLSFYFQPVGKGTVELSEAHIGDKYQVMGPLGSPFNVIEGTKSAVIIAGGIGAAMFLFLARKLKEANCGEIIYFVGARTSEELLFVDEMRKLGAQVIITTDDGSLGEKCMVNIPLEYFLEKEFKKISTKETKFYACGPRPMLKCLSGLAARRKLNIFASLEERMGCGFGACQGCVVKIKMGEEERFLRVCKEGPVFNLAHLIWK